MKIAYNPKSGAALQTAPDNNDITFDLAGKIIYARGEGFKGTDTTYDIFRKASESVGGYNGLVPAPNYNSNSKSRFLREDGTWVIPDAGTFDGMDSDRFVTTHNISEADTDKRSINVRFEPKWTDTNSSSYILRVGSSTEGLPDNNCSDGNLLHIQGRFSETAFLLLSGWKNNSLYFRSGNEVDGVDNTTKEEADIGLFKNAWNRIPFFTDLTGSNIKLTGYIKGTEAKSLLNTDTLNTALGKLEYKLDTTYNLVASANNRNETIENLREILDVLNGISDTDTVQAILNKYVTINTVETIYGLKTFQCNSSSTGVSLQLKNSAWECNMSTALDFYTGGNKNVPTARIDDYMDGCGDAGGCLRFFTQGKSSDGANPNLSGLAERMSINDSGVVNIWLGPLNVNGKRITDVTETVTSLDTSENYYLTWTKNGTTNNIIVPYAVKTSYSKVPRVNKNCDYLPGENSQITEEYTPGEEYNLPSNHWYHITTTEGNDSAYATQLALGMTTNAVYYRKMHGNNWDNWILLAFKATTLAGYGITDAVPYLETSAEIKKVAIGYGYYNAGFASTGGFISAIHHGGNYGFQLNATNTGSDIWYRGLNNGTFTEWKRLAFKETTLSGYGITDAVTLNTEQTITRVKTFTNGIKTPIIVNQTSDNALFIGATDNYYCDLNTQLSSGYSAIIPRFQKIGSATSTTGDFGSARKGVIRLSGNASESQLLFDHYNATIHYRGSTSNGAFTEWKKLAFKETTLSGYGITDAVPFLNMVNASNLKSIGVGYVNANGANGENGGIISFGFASYQTQIHSDYSGGNIHWRVNSNGTLTNWKNLLDSNNYSKYAVTLDTAQTITGEKIFQQGTGNIPLRIRNTTDFAFIQAGSSGTNNTASLAISGLGRSMLTSLQVYATNTAFHGSISTSKISGITDSSVVANLHAQYSTNLKGDDNRNVNEAPYSYGTCAVNWRFKDNKTIELIGTGGSFSGVLHLTPWGDKTGGSDHQLAFGYNGGIFHRYGLTDWSDWRKLAFTEGTDNLKVTNASARITYVKDSTHSMFFGYSDGSYNRGLYDNSLSNWIMYTDSSNQTFINQWLGNVGIKTGNATLTAALQVGGSILASGDITAYSDRRLKSNIQTLENRGYVEPVTFEKDGKQCIGFIAQDVEEKYPELVNSEGEYLSLNYQQYTAVLQALIIELDKRIKELENGFSKL